MSDFSGDEQARLFMLSILLIAALSGVFAMYRGRLGTAVQSAFIWGLIFLGLMIGYGFKDQILSAVDPGWASEWVDGTIELRRAEDGHFHAWIQVNGKEISFLVDTGASGIVLDARDAEAAGIDLSRLAFTGQASTANGMVRFAPVTLDEMRLGSAIHRNVRAAVNEAPMAESLLGMDYLDRFGRVTIEGDTLTLSH